MDQRMLAAAGVKAEEEQVYVSLLREGPATGDDLVHRLGLKRSQVADVMAALQHNGLAHRTPGPDEAYIPVPPHLAINQLVQRRQDELAQVRNSAPMLAALAHPQPASRRIDEFIEIVQGPMAVQQAFERVQRTAHNEICVLDAPPYVATVGINLTELDLLASGVACRTVYDQDSLATPGYIAVIGRHIAAGEQARLTATSPTKLVIADHELALLPLSSLSTDQYSALLVHPCGLLDTLVALFEAVWTRASPLVVTSENEVTTSHGITEQDRQLISLLVGGLTDEAAAARLRISKRTVLRRVGHLMALAGARSRLQLGWRAKEIGWL